MALGIYEIDSVDVNDRDDWRHQYKPGPAQGRREEGFPGIAERFVVKGPVKPADLIVAGWLVGTGETLNAAHAALHAAINAENDRKEAGTVYTVMIHGVTYQNCELAEFGSAGAIVGFKKDAVNYALRQMCSWHWRLLA